MSCRRHRNSRSASLEGTEQRVGQEESWCLLDVERRGTPTESLFPTSTGRALSRDAIEHRNALYASKAGETCPSIRSKHVTSHTMRHTCAMRLLLSDVDVTVIALWLGHEQVSTTDVYLHADMTQKGMFLAQ
ncbi:MAG TPA: tyrosine-type recombinase/integrase [Acidimicrobiales bacterium]|nr:tyrosine-type recombinase/integrase [Acidimicrobiales bacterium]